MNAVVALVHELAAYEQAADQCHLTPAQLRTALFGEEPALFGHVAEIGCEVVAFDHPTTGGIAQNTGTTIGYSRYMSLR